MIKKIILSLLLSSGTTFSMQILEGRNKKTQALLDIVFHRLDGDISLYQKQVTELLNEGADPFATVRIDLSCIELALLIHPSTSMLVGNLLGTYGKSRATVQKEIATNSHLFKAKSHALHLLNVACVAHSRPPRVDRSVFTELIKLLSCREIKRELSPGAYLGENSRGCIPFLLALLDMQKELTSEDSELGKKIETAQREMHTSL